MRPCIISSKANPLLTLWRRVPYQLKLVQWIYFCYNCNSPCQIVNKVHNVCEHYTKFEYRSSEIIYGLKNIKNLSTVIMYCNNYKSRSHHYRIRTYFFMLNPEITDGDRCDHFNFSVVTLFHDRWCIRSSAGMVVSSTYIWEAIMQKNRYESSSLASVKQSGLCFL